jgi:hypothetical protein
VSFACLAHALLTCLSCCSLDGKLLQAHVPSSRSSLSVFKKVWFVCLSKGDVGVVCGCVWLCVEGVFC